MVMCLDLSIGLFWWSNRKFVPPSGSTFARSTPQASSNNNKNCKHRHSVVRNNSRIQTNSKFKPRTDSRASNPSTRHFTDRNLNPMAQKFGKCESCGQNHSRYSCPHRRAKCFICCKTGHIQLICKYKKVCHLTSDHNTDVKAAFENISTLSPSFLSQNSSHAFKTLTSASGQKHDFIVDTGSVEPIIPPSDLNAFYLSVVIVHKDVTIRGNTGHSVPLIGSCSTPVSLHKGTSTDCKFLVSTSGPSITGLKILRSLQNSIT
ncbi:hypothetical protein T265_03727 [Opisthorchis viverrini]|uniref:Peptidase A2 domain-containing protein n=1 Tax=Opisthorchis viverrini TaxID=6198 RepID=A0A075A2G3_OPIVI|nr:hypothetical protein T265_03727 [Opisthorchis viverrini]KER29710.1 hypothetical protein T265_03727 [Opisthorchis viverrini]